MTISEPRIEPIPPRNYQYCGPLYKSLMALEHGQMIEITDPTPDTQKNALRTAKHHHFKVTTRRTKDGKLRVWRLT